MKGIKRKVILREEHFQRAKGQRAKVHEQDKVNSADSASKSMVRLVRAEKMVLSGLVLARKIARMILIQNI